MAKKESAEMMKANRLVIVGARSYIGGALWTSIPAGVESLGTASSPADGLLQLRLEEPRDFETLLVREGDVVILVAAISSPDICTREHDRAWSVNVESTSAFISSVIARKGRVIFFSSDTVYGERKDSFDEHALCEPAGEYAVMKHEVEKRFAGNPSFKAIRLSYVFSREDKFSRYLIGCAARGEEADLFHPFYRAIVHRDDVVQGVLALAQKWDNFRQQIINFGGPEILSRVEFASRLQQTAMPNLRFHVTEPGDDFFTSRPRVIAMQSPWLSQLLGRPSRTLAEAAKIEFSLV
jgi:dTDP-4-dehydrorhamnose reductase